MESSSTKRSWSLRNRIIKMSSERNGKFWIHNELKLSSFEARWFQKLNEEEDRTMTTTPDYSMNGVLDRELERTLGNRVVLAGPMVDTYLKEIGCLMSSRLSRSKVTGICGPVTIMIPWQIFRTMMGVIIGYKADTKYISGKKKGCTTEKQVFFIDKQETAEKLWSPRRFDGTNYLTKRFFKKVLTRTENGNKKETVYAGCAKVVVSTNTPIRIDYYFQNQRMQLTYYIQRYDDESIARDMHMQQLINTNSDE